MKTKSRRELNSSYVLPTCEIIRPFLNLKRQRCVSTGCCPVGDLPTELVCEIFSHLEDKDIVWASAVCSRWRHILQDGRVGFYLIVIYEVRRVNWSQFKTWKVWHSAYFGGQPSQRLGRPIATGKKGDSPKSKVQLPWRSLALEDIRELRLHTLSDDRVHW